MCTIFCLLLECVYYFHKTERSDVRHGVCTIFCLLLECAYYFHKTERSDVRYALFTGMVTAMDDAVDKVMDALRRKKFTNNLLVVFTSDVSPSSLFVSFYKTHLFTPVIF